MIDGGIDTMLQIRDHVEAIGGGPDLQTSTTPAP
jgi:hypothetical protein